MAVERPVSTPLFTKLMLILDDYEINVGTPNVVVKLNKDLF